MRKASRSFNHGGTCHMVEYHKYTNIIKCELRSAHSKNNLEFEIAISLRVRNCDSRINHNLSKGIIK